MKLEPIKKAKLPKYAAALAAAGLCAEGVTELGGVCYLERGYERFEQVLSMLGADVKKV